MISQIHFNTKYLNRFGVLSTLSISNTFKNAIVILVGIVGWYITPVNFLAFSSLIHISSTSDMHSEYLYWQKSLKIPKGQSESVYRRRTESTKTKDRVTRTALNTGGKLRCSGRVSSSCSTSGTRRVNLVTKPVISRKKWFLIWIQNNSRNIKEIKDRTTRTHLQSGVEVNVLEGLFKLICHICMDWRGIDMLINNKTANGLFLH